MPACSNRCRHRYTVGRLTLRSLAIALIEVPSAEARTMRARVTTRWGVLPLRTKASMSDRCAVLRAMGSAAFHIHGRIVRIAGIVNLFAEHYTRCWGKTSSRNGHKNVKEACMKSGSVWNILKRTLAMYRAPSPATWWIRSASPSIAG